MKGVDIVEPVQAQRQDHNEGTCIMALWRRAWRGGTGLDLIIHATIELNSLN